MSASKLTVPVREAYVKIVETIANINDADRPALIALLLRLLNGVESDGFGNSEDI